jgi:hypothetical protein
MSKPTRKSNTESRRSLKLLAINADGCIRKLDAARASRVLKGPPRARLAAFPYTRRPKKPATTMITTTTPMM